METFGLATLLTPTVSTLNSYDFHSHTYFLTLHRHMFSWINDATYVGETPNFNLGGLYVVFSGVRLCSNIFKRVHVMLYSSNNVQNVFVRVQSLFRYIQCVQTLFKYVQCVYAVLIVVRSSGGI